MTARDMFKELGFVIVPKQTKFGMVTYEKPTLSGGDMVTIRFHQGMVAYRSRLNYPMNLRAPLLRAMLQQLEELKDEE